MDKLIKTIPVRVDAADRQALEDYAEVRRLKLADIIREAVFEYIGSHNLKVKHQESKDEVPGV